MMSEAGKEVEELLRLYNEVDSFLRGQYRRDKYADHSFLLQELAQTNPTVARNQQLLRAVAQLRNVIVHNPIPSSSNPIAQPTAALIERYQAVRDTLLRPHTALSIAVPRQKIFTSTKSAKLIDVIKTMAKNIFTHVPILENDEMIGVFSENSLLSYLASNGEAIITHDMTIDDLADFLSLSSHRGEMFAFLPRHATLGEVYDIFNKAIKKRQRVGMVFITEHGFETEKPLGIITAWDLASPDFASLQ
jgi:CBS domain-containing protein